MVILVLMAGKVSARFGVSVCWFKYDSYIEVKIQMIRDVLVGGRLLLSNGLRLTHLERKAFFPFVFTILNGNIYFVNSLYYFLH